MSSTKTSFAARFAASAGRFAFSSSWLVAALAGCSGEGGEGGDERPARRGAALDVHLHLASPALTRAYAGPDVLLPSAAELIERLDEAEVDRGVVLAPGYMPFDDASDMALENDFSAAELSEYPERLIGFCGINPLLEGAEDEVGRCLDLPEMRGVKLHLPASGVDLESESHLEALAGVLGRVSERGAPLLVHLGEPSGLPLSADGRANLGAVLSEFPELRIAYAHCGGNMDDQDIEMWLRDADFNRERSFVDVSACLKFYRDAPLSKRELIVWRFRQWGIERVLLGSDYLVFQPEETPKQAIETLGQYPFSEAELDLILGNDGSAWLEDGASGERLLRASR